MLNFLCTFMVTLSCLIIYLLLWILYYHLDMFIIGKLPGELLVIS